MSKTSKNRRGSDVLRTVLTVLLAVVILGAIAGAVLLLSNGGKDEPAPVNTETTELPTVPVTEPTEQTPETGEPSIEAPQAAFPYEIPGFTLLPDTKTGALENDLELLGVGCYTGPYFEDGSDEEVSDVYAAVVKNNGADWVDFAVITMACGDQTATFEISALPGGTAVLVLESTRMGRTVGEACSNPHAICTEDLTPHIYDFDDTFALYTSDGVINLKNISETSFENDILVYYKNYDYGLFLGGVTYRARFGGIAAGEIGQSIQSHYSDARSMILYLSYDD